VLGDNLGSHQIGGFTKNFHSSEYFCRFCDITQNQLQLKHTCSNINRSPNNYNLHVKQAKTAMRSVKGIKQDSPLNQLDYFHVCNPGLPPCIAHDLFEGIVPYDLMYCIKYFVKESWFTSEFLNFRLKRIKILNENASNNISLIKISASKITGTASQIKRLLLLFPLAVFDSIKNIEDNVWLLVLNLQEICSLICAPALSFGQVALLQEKINEYLLLRLTCFPDIRLRPKHHYISHYPSLILAFGPLKHLWTLRFESKHKYFKNIIKHSQNFKNITKLLTQKHQFLQNQHCKNIYCDLVIADNAEEYIPENFSMNISSIITDYFYNRNENFKYVALRITFRGIMYKTHMCICVGQNYYSNFIICKIKYILINSNYSNVYFVDTTIEVTYNSDFGIYEVFEIKGQEYNTDKISLYPYSSLLMPHPVLETCLNSIPIYIFKYAPLDL